MTIGVNDNDHLSADHGFFFCFVFSGMSFRCLAKPLHFTFLTWQSCLIYISLCRIKAAVKCICWWSHCGRMYFISNDTSFKALLKVTLATLVFPCRDVEGRGSCKNKAIQLDINCIRNGGGPY